MIRIHKSATVPATLATKGAAETATMCAEYDAHRGDYRRGEKRFVFEREIYGAPDVKSALKNAQHGKCAFCESKITHVVYGDVEHFRPKGGFTRRGKLKRPAYYWLAYEWENLVIACQLCNQRHKRNEFPLAGGSMRARSHHADIAKESPRFVHPAKEDPSASIGFRDHVAYAVGGDLRGRKTIRGLGLNRVALREKREEVLTTLRRLRDLVAVSPPSPERTRAQRHLDAALRDDAEFSAMVRAFLSST